MIFYILIDDLIHQILVHRCEYSKSDLLPEF